MLTTQEKAALAHILIEELDSSNGDNVEQIWIAESQRRYDAYLKGELKALDGDEVVARARRQSQMINYPFLPPADESGTVVIVAVAHHGRRPGYWQSRLGR